MPKFRKVALPPGTHHTPDGTVTVTPERVKSWRERFRALKSEGFKIPVSWGHHSQAQPYSADDAQMNAARWNAGYVDEVEVTDKGELLTVLDIPGADGTDDKGNILTTAELPDGRKVKCAISEVSIAVDNIRDGKGRLWPDVIKHVALTPLPVWHGQEGFQAASDPPAPTERRLSLSTLLFSTERPMADEEKKDDKPPEKKDGDSKGPPEKKEAEPETGRAALVAKCIEGLAKCNPPIQLPQDTDASNFLEYLNVALVAYAGATAAAEEDEGFESEGGGPPLTEQTTGAFMSLLSHEDPLVRQLAEQHQKAAEKRHADEQAQRTAKIDALVKRGLAPAIARQLKDKCALVRFSLEEGKSKGAAGIDAQLSLLDAVLPRKAYTGGPITRKVKEVPAPHVASDQEVKELTESMIAMASGKPSPNGK